MVENPLCGELYDGQLLELVVRVAKQNPEIKHIDLFKQFELDIDRNIAAHKWNTDAEKVEYISLVKQFGPISRILRQTVPSPSGA